MSKFNEEIDQLYERARLLFWRKNASYGTANVAEGGLRAVVARLTDKVHRAANVAESSGDSVEVMLDTALDIANYGIILAALATGKWPDHDDRRSLLVTGKPDHIRRPARPGDVGFDLCAATDHSLPPHELYYVPTGVSVLCPRGMWCRIVGRSSLARKRRVLCVEGIIDGDYTGELEVGCLNLTDKYVFIKAGERIAQVIFCPALVPEMTHVDELPNTERGASGFGSTGHS